MRHCAALLIHVTDEVTMSIGNPLILVVFFGIFHVIGGLGLGKGIRERITDPKAGNQLIAWGLIMGALPIVFDWFFLIRVGHFISGLVGPTLFIIAALVGGIHFTGELSRKNEKSIGAIMMGGTALMLGLMLTPYLIQQAGTRDDLGLVDYLCGGSIPVFFILIGTNFVWTGFTAIRKHLTFDERIAEREIEVEEKAERNSKKAN